MDTSIFKVLSGEIVGFFNAVQTPVQLSRAIVDDPNYGKPLADGISISLARHILKERDSTFQGAYNSLEDIDKIKGVGPSTWHNILVSVLLKKMEVLMPNRRAHDHIGVFNFKD